MILAQKVAPMPPGQSQSALSEYPHSFIVPEQENSLGDSGPSFKYGKLASNYSFIAESRNKEI
jgi:hypothetical protein